MKVLDDLGPVTPGQWGYLLERDWLESLAQQDRLNDIRAMRLDAQGRFLVARYGWILWWLDAVESLSNPYLRED